jgi:hypothetical protein
MLLQKRTGVRIAMGQIHKYFIPHFPEYSMSWAGHVARMGEVRGAYNILVGKPEGRRPLGRSRRRWEDNIKMDLGEIGFGMWIGFIWLRIGTGGELL